MWQDRQYRLLSEEIEALLFPLVDVADLHDLIKELPIRARRKFTSDTTYHKPWPILPLIVCEAISGSYEHATPAAAALQLLFSAAEVLDDIEDADFSESLSARYGSAVATNVATTLIILAERGITRLKRKGVEPYTIVRVMDTMNSFYTTACAGQHLDLSLNPKIAASEDMYLKVIGMKSASTVECACRVGVLLATTNQILINSLDSFGYNLGIASQITNDILGITRGSDIAKLKITLPVIYALYYTDSKTRDQLEDIFIKRSDVVFDPQQIKDLLLRSGAIHYATIKMEYYRQKAQDILLKTEVAGVRIERLKLFLE